MSSIVIEGLSFHAYHGVYPEERELGRTFEVDLYLHTDIHAAARKDSISDTIDYARVASLVAGIMQQPVNLIETLAVRIAGSVLDEFPSCSQVEVRVHKFAPPMEVSCRRTTVIHSLSR